MKPLRENTLQTREIVIEKELAKPPETLLDKVVSLTVLNQIADATPVKMIGICRIDNTRCSVSKCGLYTEVPAE